MKKFFCIAAIASVFGLAVYAAQDVAIERVEVRDPVRLEAFLEANAADAQARIAALEGSLGTNPVLAVTVGALTTTGIVTISEGKLADSVIVSADIKDGVIVNADISAGAAIAATKIGAGSWMTGAVTNQGVGTTNVTWYVGGMVVSNTFNPQ